MILNLLSESTESSSGGGLVLVIYLVIIFVFMYFVMIRPQRKEQKRMSALLASMEVGDVVVTTSGFYGIVISIQDDDCIVEFGNNKNCRIPMRKSAIAEVEKANAEPEPAKESRPAKESKDKAAKETKK